MKYVNYSIFFLYVFIIYAQLDAYTSKKPLNIYKFKNIENKGIYGIVGKTPVYSLSIDSVYYLFTYENNMVKKIQSYCNGKSILFPCPSFYNPFDTASLSSIEYQYSTPKNIIILFFKSDRTIIFRQIIEKDSVEILHLNSTGVLIKNDSGIAKIILKYDLDSNLVELRQYNDLLQISTNSDDVLDYENLLVRAAIKKWKYQGGKKIEQINYYEDGRLWDFIKWKYDSVGNTTEEAYFNNTGGYTNGGYNLAKIEYKYDKNRNKISECYFDEYGKPTYGVSGACREWEHYESGKIKQVKFYDTDGQLMAGEAIIKNSLDSTGNYATKYMLDKNGILIDSTIY